VGRLIKALHLPLLATFFLIAASLLVLVKSSFFSVEAQSVGGRIAFTSNRDGDFDIYVMNSNDLDDSDAINITNTLYYEAVIGWAADKIAFWSDKEGAMEMYVMDDNGGNIRKLQTPGGYVGYDTLSPDGTKISVTAGGVFNTYIVPTDGSPNYNLLPNRSCLNAEWSWDSQQLICMSSESSPDGIGLWLVNADGSNPRWTGLAARNAVWLPSSTRIIFHNDYDGLLSIADMEIPESTTPLIPNMNGMDPRITSNGNRVVFRLDGPGYQRIYTNTIDATDDSNLQLIAESPGY
jgi:TolB protein